jgi:hypothetical protein
MGTAGYSIYGVHLEPCLHLPALHNGGAPGLPGGGAASSHEVFGGPAELQDEVSKEQGESESSDLLSESGYADRDWGSSSSPRSASCMPQGWQGRRGARGAGRQKRAPRGGARGAVKRCGALLGSMMMRILFDLRVRTGSA